VEFTGEQLKIVVFNSLLNTALPGAQNQNLRVVRDSADKHFGWSVPQIAMAFSTV
jgi:hypothetical protein